MHGVIISKYFVNICGKSLQQPLQLLVPVVVAVMVPRAPTLPFLTDFSLLLQHVYKVVTVQTRYNVIGWRIDTCAM